MLKPRIIPCLDVSEGRVVKGVNFVDLVDAGDPVEQAKLYNDQGADELCFLDITASSDARDTIYDVVTQVAETCFIPLTVGGGVRTLEDIRRLLNAGADKVSINTAAVKTPEFVREAAEKFGSQCIVVAIDARKTPKNDKDRPSLESVSLGEQEASQGDYTIFTHGGRNPTGLNAVVWAQKMVDYGAGELLVTSMDRDGTKQGFDIPMTRAIADAVNVPIIASGGVGKPEDFIAGVRDGHASGLLAASIFHFGTHRIAEVKEAMTQAGIAMRL